MFKFFVKWEIKQVLLLRRIYYLIRLCITFLFGRRVKRHMYLFACMPMLKTDIVSVISVSRLDVNSKATVR